MVEHQVVRRGVADPLVLAALREVPREAFIGEEVSDLAYADVALPISAGQTISQPFVVARMLELAEIGREDSVLEVGTGSGYAAAVMSRIARRVVTLERHAILAVTAEHRLGSLGYDNVAVYHRDGTLGLADEAPFDAIVVSAAGPRVPRELLRQLAIGGRLVIPVGGPGGQRLRRIVRRGEKAYQEKDEDVVRFVPLISGEAAETEGSVIPTRAGPGLPPSEIDQATQRRALAQGPRRKPVCDMIREAAEPFRDFEQLSLLIDRYADRKVVLLGEGTHGTSEMYQVRTWITERLVALHGFSIVAVEADWPDAAAYDAYVRKLRPPRTSEVPFSRFPRWMWRNHEVYDLLERLQAANARKPTRRDRAGFYGLDLYSLSASIAAVIGYLERVDSKAAAVARERYSCLRPWCAEPARYGRMALSAGFHRCEAGALDTLRDLLDKRLTYMMRGGDDLIDAEQNARIVAEAEHYYRALYYGSSDAWNLRDRHMMDTLRMLLHRRGPDAKAVVWAHNSHVGDAAFTDMGREHGEISLGQLCRHELGDDTALIGFGTDRGTVAAASEWGGAMQVRHLRPAHADSFEGVCRRSGLRSFLLDLEAPLHSDLRHALTRPMLQRAVGVIYRPETEMQSHYLEAEPARQFDAWVWIEETHAVNAAPTAGAMGEPETFPFGV